MKICGIYKITSPSNKIYIGQSVDCLNRFRVYARYKCVKQKKLLASLLKYGYENHKIEIICQCDIEKLNELEKYYVDLYNTFNSNNGLNIRDGGGSTAKMSEEQKIKIGNSNRGKKRTEEHVKIMSQIRKGRKLSKENRDKLILNNSKYWLGKKFSEEHKKKLSERKIGKPSLRKGIRHSEETKQKIKDKRKLQICKPHNEETKIKISQSLKKRNAEH